MKRVQIIYGFALRIELCTEYNIVCTYTRWPFACIYLPKYGGAKHKEKDENGDKDNAMQRKGMEKCKHKAEISQS